MYLGTRDKLMRYKLPWPLIISISNNLKCGKTRSAKPLSNTWGTGQDIPLTQSYNKPKVWILLSSFLVHLFFPLLASASSKNSIRLQKCQRVFSDVDSFVKQIKESSPNIDIVEIWKGIPAKKRPAVVKKIFTKEEFETTEYNQTREKVVEAIKEIKSADPKIQNILADHLGLFKELKHAVIREKIYSLFETIAPHITVKVARKLAKLIIGEIPINEKKSIIKILRKRKSKDALTIQYLGEGLNSFSVEVRKNTIEALGEILGNERTLLKWYYGSIHLLFVHPVKILFTADESLPDVRIYILSKLQDKILYDPNPLVRGAAIEALDKVNTLYARGIGYFY